MKQTAVRFVRFLCALGAVFLIIFINTSSADEYHYNNLLIGDRASGMGGAYTAVSDDATGLYYNPAGVAYATGRNLSASVNAYYNLTKTYDGVIGGHGWERKSSALLPNYFGIVQPLGKLKFGFSYAVPDSSKEDQDQTFSNLSLNPTLQGYNPGVNITSYTINFNNDDNTYQFGPTFAGEIARNLAAGITLYIHQRKVQRTLNQFILFSNSAPGNESYEWTSSFKELSETGVKPVIGIMYSPMDKLSIGVAVSKVVVLSSDLAQQQTKRLEGITVPFDVNGDGIIVSGETTTSLFCSPTDPFCGYFTTKEKKRYPIQTTVGIAYFPTADLLLSADFTYFTKVDDSAFGDREAVLNAAFGAEYYMSRSWALRAGLFTNMANTPEIKAGTAAVADEHTDLYGGSLSISNFTRNTSVTLGGNMSYGTGTSQITTDATKTQDMTIFGWAIFLSSSYSY